jgi:dTDP-4-amino-4,6-dideoxygalactose transaminase
MDALLDICNRRGLVLVEDAAHAHGSEWDGRKIGSFGHIACFSMQGSDPGGKPVTSGEGGILVTNDRELYERALIHAHLHRTGALEELSSPVYSKLEHQLLGWKWRAHPLAVALARVSLKSLPERIERFAANRDELFEGIKGLPGVEPAHNYPKARGSELYGGLRFLYSPQELGGLEATRFCEALQAEGVPMSAGGFRKPEHLRAIYTMDLPGLWGRGHPGPANVPLPRYKEGDYPVTEALVGRVLAMPGWIECVEGLIEQVAAGISKVVKQHRKLL